MPKVRVFRHEVIQPLDQSYRLIPLTQGQNAIVDASDFEWLSQWNWCAWWNPKAASFYATRKGCKWTSEKNTILMHRQILSATKDQVDHRNLDTLDNRRSNLRLATKQQNMQNVAAPCTNKSGFKGVSWNKARQRWIAQLSWNNHSMYIGGYDTAEKAARAYNELAIKYHGEFARLNNISD